MITLQELEAKDKGLACEMKILRGVGGIGGLRGYLAAMYWRDEISTDEWFALNDQAKQMAAALGVQS